jgi:hypothetical protein
MKGVMSYYIDGKHKETRVYGGYKARKVWMNRVIKTVGVSNLYRLVFIVAIGVELKDYEIKEIIEI